MLLATSAKVALNNVLPTPCCKPLAASAGTVTMPAKVIVNNQALNWIFMKEPFLKIPLVAAVLFNHR